MLMQLAPPFALIQGNPVQALQQAQKALFVEPSRIQLRRDLATLTLQMGRSSSAHALLSGISTDGVSIADLREVLALTAAAEVVVVRSEMTSNDGKMNTERRLRNALRNAQKSIIEMSNG